MLIINDNILIPLEEIQFSYVRSSGPGGQNVNKVASKAVMRWSSAQSHLPESAIARFKTLFPRCWLDNGEIMITSQRTRDALKNKADCLEKLRKMIERVIKEPKRRIPTRPTKGSIKRRLENKAKNSLKKQNRGKIED